MLIINNVFLPLDSDFSDLKTLVSKHCKIAKDDIITAALYKKSVDARKKPNILFCCSFLISVKNEKKALKVLKHARVFEPAAYEWKKSKSSVRPLVVGFGPAGMFCALTLARAGLRPIVIERGEKVNKRVKDVNEFFGGGPLNPDSNVQFGEGGAGTFSDGKLNTGIKDIRCKVVLEQFVKFGADSKILYEAKPHIGTDKLVDIVKNIRNEIDSLGGSVLFNSRLTDIEIKQDKLCAAYINGERMECSAMVLATGHSARDTFYMLKERGLKMERKPFAMGARIEHLQSDINYAMYGDSAKNPALENADYKLAVHLKNGRSVYTFCMCPGGQVVNASSEVGMVAVNGMSLSARDGKNANSALLVEVLPSDLKGDDVLEGIKLQRDIEKKAYDIDGGAVPFCYVGDITGESFDKTVSPTVLPKTVRCDIQKVLPGFIADSIKNALSEFDKKISGFGAPGSVLTFPETRSSSPVRVLRDSERTAIGVSGLYPTGEGAGYAGGIMSAAVDGIKTAEKIIETL